MALSQPGWPPTPCFVRRVWNVLGHRALLPGGDTGAIALISLLDRFSPSFQLRDSAGSQLPASARPSSSASVLPLAATSLQLGEKGFPGEPPPAGLLRGPWASLFKLDQPFPSCPSSQAPSNVTPPPTHSSHPTNPHPCHSGGLRSSGNHVLRTLETWDRLDFARCPHFCPL